MEKELNQRIVQLLSEVVDRTREIDYKNGDEVLLDIDLIMGDLRELYKEFELMRQQITMPLKVPKTPETITGSINPDYRIPEPHQPPQVSMDTKEQKKVEAEQVTLNVMAPPDSIPKIATDENVGSKPKQHDAIPAEPGIAAVETHQPTQPIFQAPGEIFSLPSKPIQPSDAQSGEMRVSAPKQETPRTKPEPHSGLQFSQEDNSLHRRLAAQREDKSLSVRLQMTPISNIKDAIGINEKFLFINELFAGNLQQYNEAILRLNHFANLDEAFTYLNALGNNLQWDETHSGETIEKLAGIVMRRYMSK